MWWKARGLKNHPKVDLLVSQRNVWESEDRVLTSALIDVDWAEPYIHTLHNTFVPLNLEGQKCHEALALWR